MCILLARLTRHALDPAFSFPTRLPLGSPIASVHIRDHLIFQTPARISADLRQLFQSSVKQLISLTGRQ